MYAARRIHAHLGRFAQELSRVIVRIGDINGPRGGIDKRCLVTVRGRRLGTSTLDDVSGDAYAAVDSAIERIARAVARGLERARRVHHVSPARRRLT